MLSDLHKGASISKYKGELQTAIEEKIKQADHIVLNGDVFELFDILNVRDASRARFGLVEDAKKKMEKASDEAIEYLEKLLKSSSKRQFHFVLGNHENLRYFTNRLDELQSKYDHFNWSPEAIRLGDALFTHGDLQMHGQVHGDSPAGNLQARGEFRLRDVRTVDKVVETMKQEWFSSKLQTVTERWQVPRALTSAALSIPGLSDLLIKGGLLVADLLGHRPSERESIKLMHDYLHNPEISKNFHYLEENSKIPKLFTMSGIKHVFFGHTHQPFTGKHYDGKEFDKESDASIIYHNTGSAIKAQGVTIKRPETIQALSAELKNGKIENVRRAFAGPSTGMSV